MTGEGGLVKSHGDVATLLTGVSVQDSCMT